MEERKLQVDPLRKETSTMQKYSTNEETRLDFQRAGNASFMGGDGYNENWFELRFLSLGPDRRGFHATFQHNKK